MDSHSKIGRRSFVKYGVAGAVVAAGAALAAYYGLQAQPVTPVTLKFVNIVTNYEPIRKVANELIGEWNKSNPNIQVSFETVNFGEGPDRVAKSVAAGVPIDIIEDAVESMSALWEQKRIVPMDDVLKDLGGEKFYGPGILRLVSWDGHTWALPVESVTLHHVYRKDWFQEKGLKEPKNWDGYLEVLRALTDTRQERYGIAMPLTKNYFLSSYEWTLFLGNGGHFVDETGRKVVFESEESVEALEFIKEVFKYAPPGSAAGAIGELRTPFVKGKVGMTWYSRFITASDVSSQAPELETKIDIMPIPPSGRRGNTTPKLRWTGASMMLGSDSKYMPQAKAFIKWWMSVKQLTKYLKENQYLGSPPAVAPVLEDPQLFDEPRMQKWLPLYKKHADLSRYAVAPTMEYPDKGTLTPSTAIILSKTIWMSCVQDVVINNVPAREAVKKWALEMKKITGEVV